MITDMQPHIAQVYESLLGRIRSGLYRPGDRFMSNRAVVMRFGISYQTAHRLLARLVDGGLLQRADRSGTFIAGRADKPTGVVFVFHPRAKVKGSFGGKLLASLREAFEAARQPHSIVYAEQTDVPPQQLPIL